MQNLPTDVLRLVALELDDASLLSVCRGNKRMNRVLCDSEIFWQQKHLMTFGSLYLPNMSWKESYNHYKRLTKSYSSGDCNLFHILGLPDINDKAVFVGYLLENYPPPKQSKLDSALGLAARMGYIKIADLLINYGANPNSTLYLSLEHGPPLLMLLQLEK